jgi:hypothetical protein
MDDNGLVPPAQDSDMVSMGDTMYYTSVLDK